MVEKDPRKILISRQFCPECPDGLWPEPIWGYSCSLYDAVITVAHDQNEILHSFLTLMTYDDRLTVSDVVGFCEFLFENICKKFVERYELSVSKLAERLGISADNTISMLSREEFSVVGDNAAKAILSFLVFSASRIQSVLSNNSGELYCDEKLVPRDGIWGMLGFKKKITTKIPMDLWKKDQISGWIGFSLNYLLKCYKDLLMGWGLVGRTILPANLSSQITEYAPGYRFWIKMFTELYANIPETEQ